MVLTNWVDVIKVRQQLAGPQARNLAATCWHVVRSEGPLALQQGITPAVARGVLYGGAARAGRAAKLFVNICCWVGYMEGRHALAVAHGTCTHAQRPSRPLLFSRAL